MLTLLFTKFLGDIINKLKVEELIEVLDPLVNSDSKTEISPEQRTTIAELIFQSREGFSALCSSSECKSIIESLGIKNIYQSANLAGMLTVINTVDTSEGIITNPKNYSLFRSFLSNLTVMQSFYNTIDQHLVKQKLPNVSEIERVIEIEVFDFQGNGVSVSRLSSILESLQKLHQMICRVLEEKQSRMHITYVDSGSDIMIGLHCSMKISELMKTLFSQFWQKVKYKQYDEFEKAHDYLVKGLNITQHIIRQEKNGIFDADQASKYKYALIDEMIKLTSSGVVLKDVDGDNRSDRKKLMLDKREIRS